jgi:uncharacterized protein YtpQ (UPF0354 family)
MNMLEHIRAVREKYVAALKKVIAEHRDAGDLRGVEVMLEAAGEGGNEGGRRETLCADVMAGEEGKPGIIMVMNQPPEGGLVGVLRAGAVEVAVFPFAWEACRFHFRLAKPEWEPVEAWFKKWSERSGGGGGGGGEERAAPFDEAAWDADGLLGIVHYISKPMREGRGYLLELDFGSAPVDAFMELIGVLEGMGATEVQVGTPDGSELDPKLADKLRKPELSPEDLMEVVAGILREAEEVDRVEMGAGGEDLTLRIYHSDRAEGGGAGAGDAAGEPSQANLWNLWRRCQRLPPEARAKEVIAAVRVHLEALVPSDERPDLAQLRPVIKDQGFVDYVRQQMKSETPMAWRPLAGDLWVLYVWDSASGMRFLKNEEPAEYGLNPEQTDARAIENYLRYRNPVDVEEAGDGAVSVARTHDSYDATLLLDETFWNETQEKVGGTLLACVPVRDTVLFTSTARNGGESELKRLAKQLMDGGDHLISETVLRWKGGNWEVHMAGSGPATVQPRVEREERVTMVKKRPWWKFWG